MSRVLVLCKDFHAPGGVANFVKSILTHLPSDVEAMQLSIGRPTGRETRTASLIAPLKDNLALVRAMREFKPHCVHLNPSFNWSSLLRDGLFLLVLRLMRFSNVLVFFHGWRDDNAATVRSNRLLRWLFSTTFGWARVTCVLATRFKQTLEQLGLDPRSVCVMTTMFDTQNFDGLARSENARQRPGQQLVFLGRIVEQKGIFETVEAYARLKPDYPELALVIAGDGPDLDKVRQQVQRLDLEDVEFAGYVTGASKAQLLLDSDLFVFPTYYPEGCPVSLLEAMAAGLPLVSSTAGGISDILDHDVHGILLDEINVETVESQLRRLLEDDQLRGDMQIANRELAWREFVPDAVVARIVALYEPAGAFVPS